MIKRPHACIFCIYNLSCFVEHLSVLIYTIVTGFLIVHILYFNVLVENIFFNPPHLPTKFIYVFVKSFVFFSYLLMIFVFFFFLFVYFRSYARLSCFNVSFFFTCFVNMQLLGVSFFFVLLIIGV